MDSYLPAWVTTIYTTMGLFAMVFGLPLTLGLIPRNAWYGWRTPQTLKSDAFWLQCNRLFGGTLLLGGGTVYAMAIYFFRVSAAEPEFAIATWNLWGFLGICLLGSSGLSWILHKITSKFNP